MSRRRRTPVIAAALVVAIGCAGGAMTVYALGGQTQLEGLFLGGMLGSLALAAVLWSRHLMPAEPVIEDRPPLASSPEDRAAVADELAPASLARRRLLSGLAAVAGGSALAAFLFPVRSLGPRPGRALFETPWTPGRRAVDEEGGAVRAADLAEGAVLTVFPEGHVGSADGQALLIRVGPGLLTGPVSEGSADGGLVAYSKVCTHAGCPVGLYQRESHLLLCPCHQSTFDVVDGARPTFGPATRPLPQLPLGVDRDGFVVARGDFSDAVGPGFWNRPARRDRAAW